MNTLKVFIVCMTILLLGGGIIYTIWDFNKNKNPYDQCLDKCTFQSNIFGYATEYNQFKISCIENCNSVFKEVALDFLDKGENIFNNALELTQGGGSGK